MNKGLSAIFTSFREVFSRPPYVVLSIVILVSFLIFIIWLPNIRFLSHTATSDIFTFSEKVGIIGSTLGGFQTNFSFFSRTIILLVVFLFAVNMSFLTFYLLRVARFNRSAGLGISGFMLGIIGIGCASCGSVILSALFGIGATAGFIGLLPFKGQEFGLISIILLSLSIYLLAKKIKDPIFCKIKPIALNSLFKRMPPWTKIVALIILAFFLGSVLAYWLIV